MRYKVNANKGASHILNARSYWTAWLFADQTGSTSPSLDASKFEPTSVLGFPGALIAEQLTKIETVSLYFFGLNMFLVMVKIKKYST